MNAKELREAAGLIHNWDERVHPLDKPLMAVAEYVLATVRDDDDEPIDDNFIAEVGWEPDYLPTSPYRKGRGQNSHLLIYDTRCKHVSTGCSATGFTILEHIEKRGQFRKLCEGLGIQLKETT